MRLPERLPEKPCEDAVLRVRTPRGWSWRIKAGVLLIRLAAWVLGAGFKYETGE